MKFEQKLQKIESYEAANDWVIAALQRMAAPLEQKIDEAPESPQSEENPFGLKDEEKILGAEDYARLSRIRTLYFTRCNRLHKKQEAIRSSFTIGESEQLIIS